MLIGITGKKKSGKDSLFHALQKINPRARRFAFADALKSEVAEACNVPIEFIELNKDIFRSMLQWWGTDFRRRFYGDNYWVERMDKRINTPPFYLSPDFSCFLPIITDIRFPNEADYIQKSGGVLVRVIGGQSVDGDSHPSETAMDNYPVDYTLVNDGDLNKLDASAETLLLEIGLLKFRNQPNDCFQT